MIYTPRSLQVDRSGRVLRKGLPARVAATMAALLLSGLVYAGNSGWTDYTTVAELTPSSQQRYTVRLNLSDNPSGCSNKDTFYQDYDASGAELIYRTLLEALASGKRVRVFVTGRCELNGYSELSSVSILP